MMIKLAFIGTNEGNGHIFSWSAIINGRYDPELMKRCGYPVIYDYLSSQPQANLGIPDARVTHVWTHDKKFSEFVAKTCFIENIMNSPEEAVGKVDAVIITTDIASQHIILAKPFIEKNIPVFIDKPLTDNEKDLKEFYRWHMEGRPFMSCSSVRYAKEIDPCEIMNAGRLLFISGIMSKTWERYGVHAVEGLYTIAGGNIKSVQNLGEYDINLVLVEFWSGLRALLQVIYNSNIFGRYDIFGEKKTLTIETRDYFHMFKRQLEKFLDFVRTGKLPFQFSQTIEIIKVVIAGIKSRNEKRKVFLEEICLEE
ncbi:MAG: Gfo/Idh/MocA family oxidoreductase [Candidatus Omnitrophica bacterium]|nr:Gfo/Idh/MocA family oxidoreductase [Candidatus Omnitrophota bacterium]